MRSTSIILIEQAMASTMTSTQMCFSLQNLSVPYNLIGCRNNNEPALEQLFDKLVKKALTHVNNNRYNVHMKQCLSEALERLDNKATSGRTKTEQPTQEE